MSVTRGMRRLDAALSNDPLKICDVSQKRFRVADEVRRSNLAAKNAKVKNPIRSLRSFYCSNKNLTETFLNYASFQMCDYLSVFEIISRVVIS